MNVRLIMCCLLLLERNSGVSGQSDQSARNVSAVTGDRVQFSCSTDSFDSSPEWYHAYIGCINPIAVYKDGRLQRAYDTGRYSVETSSPGRLDLIIDEVEIDDAGDFICLDGTTAKDEITRTSLHVDDEDLSVKPLNAVAIVGSNVTMFCSTTYKSTSVWWKHRPVGVIELKDVFRGSGLGFMNGYAAGGRHSVDADPDTGKYNLIIRGLESRDAGTYVCVDQDGQGHTSSAELTVIANSPECSPKIVFPEVKAAEPNCIPDLIQMICRVRYSGAQKPTLSWSYPAGISPSTSTLVEKGEVVSTMKFTMSPEIKDHVFRCYIEGTEEHSCQLTVPANAFGLANWTHMNTIDEPQLFNCSSSTSSNTCDHSWIKEDDELVSSGPLLQVDSAGEYYCKATCSVRGLPCMVFPMAVKFRGTEGPSSYSVAFITTGSIFGGLLSCLLIVIVWLHKKKQRWLPVEVEAVRADMKLINIETPMPPIIKVDTPSTFKLWTDGKKLKSFAMVNDRMYAVYQRCPSVYVYNYSEQLRLIDEIVVGGMRAPKDITACEKYNCIYVSDSEVKCIWKVFLNEPKEITKYASDFNAPYGISVSQNGTIVAVDEAQNSDGGIKTSVLLYHRKSARATKKIDPEKITKPIKYAMMMSKHTCVACLEREIVEVDKLGKVLRQFPDESHPGFLKNLLPIVVQTNGTSLLLLLDIGSSKVYLLSEEFTLLGEPQDIYIRDPQNVKKIGYHENQLIIVFKSGAVVVEPISIPGTSEVAGTSQANNNNNKTSIVDYDFDDSDSGGESSEGKPMLPSVEQETNVIPELT